MRGKIAFKRAFSLNGNQIGTNPTEDAGIAIISLTEMGSSGVRPDRMKPERLFTLWMTGVLLTEQEAAAVTRFMDENRIGTRRPVPGVSIRAGEKERKERLAAEKAARRAARLEAAASPKPKPRKRRRRKIGFRQYKSRSKQAA